MSEAAPALAAPRRRFSSSSSDMVGVAVVAAVAAGLAFVLPEDLALLTRVVVGCLFVLSLDLVVGYCGVASLGHAAMFGVGAYAAGYGALQGLADPVVMLAVGLISGAALGLASGALILRRRGLSQIVLSIAIAQLVQSAANRARTITGGSDGLSDFVPAPLFGVFKFDLYERTSYSLAVVVLVVTLLILLRIVRSPFGAICRGIREDEVRVAAMGVSVYPKLLTMYGISGAVAGMAGALSAVTTKVVGLNSLSFEWSAEALVMLVLGGKGLLFGGVLGAFLFTTFQHFVSAFDPYNWFILLGVLLVTVVLLLPQGLIRLAQFPRAGGGAK